MRFLRAISVRTIARRLIRAPTFSIPVVLSLMLGIGASDAVFRVFEAVLLRPLPYASPSELVALWLGSGGAAQYPIPEPYLRAWIEANRSLTTVAYYNPQIATIANGTEPEEVVVVSSSPGLAQVLGVRPLAGRFIGADDERANAPPVVVLSYDTWQRSFQSDPNIVGRTVIVSDQQTTVVGVMPHGFAFPPKSALWQPRRPAAVGAAIPYAQVVARMRRGLALHDIQRDLGRVARPYEAQIPDQISKAEVVVQSLHDQLFGSVRTAIIILFAAVSLLFLVACANVANLMLARALRRSGEFAVRASLGAGPAHLVLEVLSEGLMLALFGGMLGVLVSTWLTRAFAHLWPAAIASSGMPGAGGVTLAYAFGLSCVSAVLVGGVAAAKVSADSIRPILTSDGQRTGDGRLVAVLRRTLVITQVAAAVVLLTTSTLLLKSLSRLTSVDLGFQPQNVILAIARLPATRYATPSQAQQFYDATIEKLRRIPGVVDVTYGPAPLSGFGMLHTHTPVAGEASYSIAVSDIGPKYFQTYGTRILAGRGISDTDEPGTPAVVVINESAAHAVFGSRNPLGEVLDVVEVRGQHPIVVGVVSDVPQFDVAARALPEAYTATRQEQHRPMTLAIRATADPQAIANAVQRAIHDGDPNLAVRITRLSELVTTSIAPHRLIAVLLTAFAVLGVALATLGVFGVTSYLAAKRKRELTIRVALGASRLHVLGLALREGALSTMIGLSIGLLASLGVARLVASELYGVRPTDFAAFALAATVLSTTALIATLIPARSAMQVDPMAVLRQS